LIATITATSNREEQLQFRGFQTNADKLEIHATSRGPAKEDMRIPLRLEKLKFQQKLEVSYAELRIILVPREPSYQKTNRMDAIVVDSTVTSTSATSGETAISANTTSIATRPGSSSPILRAIVAIVSAAGIAHILTTFSLYNNQRFKLANLNNDFCP